MASGQRPTQADYKNVNRVRAALETFFSAAADGDVAKLEAYCHEQQEKHRVSSAETLLDSRDAHGRSALHFAANMGGEDAIDYVLEQCPAARDAVDDDGATALHLAVTGRQREAAAMLLEAGAPVDAADKSGVRPVHHAAGLGAVKTLQLLHRHGADLTAQSDAGTPLHWAAGEGRVAAVEALLALGVSPDAANGQGVTPVIMAAAKGSADAGAVVERLVAAGADTGHVLTGGLTLLHICADAGSLGAVRVIVATDHGRASATRRNVDAELPIHLAAESGHEDVVRALLPFSGLESEAAISELLGKAAHHRSARKAASDGVATSGSDAPAVSTTVTPEEMAPAENEGEAARAVDLKNQANRLFVRKEFDSAMALYNEAIAVDGSQPTFWSNRSACYFGMGRHADALRDATVARDLDPAWPKAWFRMAQAELALKAFEDAALHAWEGLKLENTSKPLKKLLQEAVAQGRKAFHGADTEAAEAAER